MSIGAAGGALGSAAGAPLSQTAGPEAERTQKESLAQQRHVDGQSKSEKASGIGETEHDEQSSERDADGRRLWEEEQKKNEARDEVDEGPSSPRKVKDPTGLSGNALDLDA